MTVGHISPSVKVNTRNKRDNLMTSTLIKAGRVFNGLTERSLEHAYVVVEGEAIATVGPSDPSRS